MKTLITGGAGFIGSHLCERLLQEGHEVVCVDNLLTGLEENIKHLKKNNAFTFVHHDITTPLPAKIGKIDALFHLASPASPNHHSPISYHTLHWDTLLANSVGTLYLAEYAKKHRAKFLFASTSEAYGDPLVHPQKEEYRGNTSTTGPRSHYDEAKRFGETVTAYFWRHQDADNRIARIFNTYGPRMNKADMRMIISFTIQALENRPITVFGDGKQTRSLCYIDDTVEGLMRLMFYPNTKGEVVNIGSTDERTVLDYANLIKKITGSQSEVVLSEKLPEDDPLRRQADITKAKEILQWEPEVSLEQGIPKTIEFFKTS